MVTEQTLIICKRDKIRQRKGTEYQENKKEQRTQQEDINSEQSY